MNLVETMEALRAKNIEVALEIGEHTRCDIDSNCPLAIQLRKVITESGITFPQLMEGYAEVTSPILVNWTPPQFDCKTSLNILGKDIDIDLTDVVSAQVKDAVTRKINNISSENERIKVYINSIHQTYINAIENQKKTKFLPQFKCSVMELISYKAMITEENGNYVFLFETVYKPEYLYQGSVRYRLSQEDQNRIMRDAYLKITVTKEWSVVSVVLLNNTGNKLQHYHGRGSDCWGTIVFDLRGKERTLRTIYNLKTLAMNSVATINMDSLMSSEPDTMPNVQDMKRRATEMGREGQVDVAPVPEANFAGTNPANQRAGWGTRRR